MAGAGVVGGMLQRVETAYRAGCDMLLVCNSPDSVADVLVNWHPEIDQQRVQRVAALLPKSTSPNWDTLQSNERYQLALKQIEILIA